VRSAPPAFTEIAMLTVPEDLALLYAAPPRSEITARMRKVVEVASQPARALAAASLIELVLAGRLTVESRRQRFLRTDVLLVTNAAGTGDADLDDVLRRVAGSDVRSCPAWIKDLSKTSRSVYHDRLVARSLLNAALAADGPVADEDAVQAVRGRLGTVLRHARPVEPRDVALVTLLAHIGHLSILLDDRDWTAGGPVGAAKATRQDERLGRDAAEVYSDLADFGAIVRIAMAAAPDPGG
jgi:hypothetical protein